MTVIIIFLLAIALVELLAASIGLVDGVVRFATALIELLNRLLDLFARRQ